jgi:hypothetical protein
MAYTIVDTWMLELKPGTAKSSVGAWQEEINEVKGFDVGECVRIIRLGTTTEQGIIKTQLITDIKKFGDGQVRMVLTSGKMYLLRQ